MVSLGGPVYNLPPSLSSTAWGESAPHCCRGWKPGHCGATLLQQSQLGGNRQGECDQVIITVRLVDTWDQNCRGPELQESGIAGVLYYRGLGLQGSGIAGVWNSRGLGFQGSGIAGVWDSRGP